MEFRSLINMVTFAGIIQGFVLSFAIKTLGKKRKIGRENLSVLFLVFSLATLGNLSVNSFFSNYRWHMFLIIPLYSLIAPLCYRYIILYTGSSRKIHPLVHMLPFTLLAALYALSVSTILKGQDNFLLDKLVTLVMALQIAAYTLMSFAAVLEFRKKIIEYYSEGNRFRLMWIEYFTGIIFISWLSALPDQIHEAEGSEMMVFSLIMSLFVYATGYIAIRFPDVLDPFEDVIPRKYLKTALDPQKASEIDRRLGAILDEGVYLEPDISLITLSKRLDIQPYQLSQVINARGVNFYELINRARIEHSKGLVLKTGDTVNVTRIAFDSGFNSISAFNAAFKKFCGMTPTEYIRKNRISNR